MDIQTINKIEKEYGTPFYLFDINKLYKWTDEVKSAFPKGVNLCYAIKANTFLLRYFDKVLNHFEVCSPGEYAICQKYGISSEKIIFSGVVKYKEDIEKVLSDDFNGVITLESKKHLSLLKEVMLDKKISSVKVLPRLTSGNKFGMSRDEVIDVVNECTKSASLELIGVQFFSGTQKKRLNVIEKELSELNAFCDEIKEKTGHQITYIEYGPGMFFDYYEGTYEDRLNISREISALIQPYLPKYQFTLEIGRYFAAICGSYITKIVDTKCNNGKNYCLVDGGIHHVNYYGRMLGMNVPNVSHLKETDGIYSEICSNDDSEIWEVGGALCTVNDVLLRNHPLNDLCDGDLLVFNDTGAYSPMEASVLFLSRTMPKVFSIEGNDLTMLRDSIEAFELNS